MFLSTWLLAPRADPPSGVLGGPCRRFAGGWPTGPLLEVWAGPVGRLRPHLQGLETVGRCCGRGCSCSCCLLMVLRVPMLINNAFARPAKKEIS